MSVYNSLDAYSNAAEGCAIALGTFDGAHLGHRALLDRTLELAREHGIRAAALTYNDLPIRTFAPDKAAPCIQTTEEKLSCISAYDIQDIICERFTVEYAHMSGYDFVASLVKNAKARYIVAGYNYTFGAGGQCGTDELIEYSRRCGAEVDIMPPVIVGGEPVSSTRVRQALIEGDMPKVSAMLGREYEISGEVRHGKRMGRELGFPTCNIELMPSIAMPRRGVYTCRMSFGDEWMPGILNIGVQPTLPSGIITCESYALTGDIGEMYGRILRVRPLRFIRPETRFDGREALMRQLERDKQAALEAFGIEKALGNRQ